MTKHLALALALLLVTGCPQGEDDRAARRTGASTEAHRPGPVVQQHTRDTRPDRKRRPHKQRSFQLITGTVTDLLPDDKKPPRHQHFIVRYRVGNGRTDEVKVAHNTDLAPRVPVKPGDTVTIKGEFIEETPMDVIHYTHHAPRGGEGGYIQHAGKTYDQKPGRKRRAA